MNEIFLLNVIFYLHIKKTDYNRMKIEIKNEIKENVKSFEGAIAKKFKSNPKLSYKYINDKNQSKHK